MASRFFTGKHRKIFDTLREVSYLSDAKFQMAAAIVRGNTIIGIAPNRMNCGSKSVRNNYLWPVEHCELAAVKNTLVRAGIKTNGDIPLREATRILKGSTIYVFRQMKNGNPAMARPCERCQKAILAPLNIKKAIYTIPIAPYFKEETFN